MKGSRSKRAALATSPTGSRPEGTSACPLQEETARLVHLGRDMLKTVRRIKRLQAACRNCSRQPDCPLLERINLQISEAIRRIAEKMGLAV